MAMLSLVLLGLVGGLITGISPCVLPVLPAVFLAGGTPRRAQTQAPVLVGAGATAAGAPTDETAAPEARVGATPYVVVAGLALSFASFTLLGTLLLSALHLPQGLLRWAGLVVLVALGIGLLVPRVEEWLERPFAWIPQRAIGPRKGLGGAFVLGLALGVVYVPCAGPILATIVVNGARGRIGGGTIALTVAFAVGAAIPLLAFALAGKRVTERVRAFRTHQRAVRAWAGVVVIALAVALAFNVTDFIQRAIPDYTAGLNQALDNAGATTIPQAVAGQPGNPTFQICEQDLRPVLQGCGAAPEFAGISQWFNTPDNQPLTMAGLRGKVVLVDFWAYSCINCQRAIPHVNAWFQSYAQDGLQVVGVHTPEYAFEHVASNVQAGAQRLGIKYPVAIDNDYGTWDAFANQSWPAEYLIDATGQVRHIAIGEGNYEGTETLIRQLLIAAHPGLVLPTSKYVPDSTPTDMQMTPETYLGSERAMTFAGGAPVNASSAPPSDDPAADPGSQLVNGTGTFTAPSGVPEDEFGLSGTWTINDESITAGADAGIVLNFKAKDVYLDLSGTGTAAVTVDGQTTEYVISGTPNIYPIVEQAKSERGRLTVALSPGLSAYSFTFG